MASKAGRVTQLEHLRTEVSKNKQKVNRASTGSRMFGIGMFYPVLHLPGYCTNNTLWREDTFRVKRRALRLDLMGQGVGFDVLGAWSVGEQKIKVIEEKCPPSLTRG